MTRDFGTGISGFAAAEDDAVAVCVLPGTELAFSSAVTISDHRFIVGWKVETLPHAMAIFRQVNKHDPRVHHDVLEFPDGRIVLLTKLMPGQKATGASTACAANDRSRGRCPEAHCLRKLKVLDRLDLCVGCLKAAYFFRRADKSARVTRAHASYRATLRTAKKKVSLRLYAIKVVDDRQDAISYHNL